MTELELRAGATRVEAVDATSYANGDGTYRTETRYSYRGVLRQGSRVVWTCEHTHPNRGYDTRYGSGGMYVHTGATHCAARELAARAAVA